MIHKGHITPHLDPMDRVMRIGRTSRTTIVSTVALALALHGTAAARAALVPLELIAWAHRMEASVHERVTQTYEIDVVKLPDPPPPEPLAPEPKAPEPAPAPKPILAKAEPAAPKAAPAAAQAGAILTSPEEPVDLTGFTTGSAPTYAGGITASTGTSTTAVYDRRARADGIVGGRGTAPAGPDRSRPPSLRGSKEWTCPWPAEADAEDLNSARVLVRIGVSADGRASSVDIMKDPGHGFGREARRCAMRESYDPALDHDGAPIVGTRDLWVTFSR